MADRFGNKGSKGYRPGHPTGGAMSSRQGSLAYPRDANGNELPTVNQNKRDYRGGKWYDPQGIAVGSSASEDSPVTAFVRQRKAAGTKGY